MAGFGASAGGAGAFVAAGVGEVAVEAGAIAGEALQPLLQLVVMMFEPQVLQPVLHPVEQVLQAGAGVAQQR